MQIKRQFAACLSVSADNWLDFPCRRPNNTQPLWRRPRDRGPHICPPDFSFSEGNEIKLMNMHVVCLVSLDWVSSLVFIGVRWLRGLIMIERIKRNGSKWAWGGGRRNLARILIPVWTWPDHLWGTHRDHGHLITPHPQCTDRGSTLSRFRV